MSATFGHCWRPAGGQKRSIRGSKQRSIICVSARHALCLLPVVLMPPTVQKLQGQSGTYYVCTHLPPSFSTISPSFPPADCGNSSPVALILSLSLVQNTCKHKQWFQKVFRQLYFLHNTLCSRFKGIVHDSSSLHILSNSAKYFWYSSNCLSSV